MRLNFSGSGEDEIHEGVRRIGAVIEEQMELFGAITHEHRVVPGGPDSRSPEAEPPAGSVIPFGRERE